MERTSSESNERPAYDADIRAALKARVRSVHANDPTTVVIDELGLRRRRARADLAVVNGIMHGYEIKSERDSLRRLPGQAQFYGEVFDRATLVTAQCYVDKAKALLPGWWEIVTATRVGDSIELLTVRAGAPNPSPSPRTRAELIWRSDALRMLGTRGAVRGLRHQPRRVLWDRLCEVFTAHEIAAEVRTLLKSRAAEPEAAGQSSRCDVRFPSDANQPHA